MAFSIFKQFLWVNILYFVIYLRFMDLKLQSANETKDLKKILQKIIPSHSLMLRRGDIALLYNERRAREAGQIWAEVKRGMT